MTDRINDGGPASPVSTRPLERRSEYADAMIAARDSAPQAVNAELLQALKDARHHVARAEANNDACWGSTDTIDKLIAKAEGGVS